MHRTVRALLSAAAAALTATTVLVGLPAGPAQAMTYDNVPLSAWSYIDKAQPSTPDANPSGDYLIGSSKDASGVKHTGRAYFTFDLTPLKGQVLHRVTFYTYEQSVDDCSQVAPIQVWRTKPVTSTTDWQHAPKELELLTTRSYGKGVICPGAYLGFDMIPAIQAAFAAGEKTVTVEVRIDASAEAAIGVGRTMSKAVMSYAANHAPTVSGLKLKYPDAGCGTLEKHPSAGTWMQVQAAAEDADPGDYARLTYAYWPVDQPDQRKQSSSPSLDLTGIPDGTVVAWTAQAQDLDDAGPWGKTCYFTVDTAPPATKPIVSSKQYPSDDYPGTGGPGVPGTFILDAAGDVSTTGFDWYRPDTGTFEHSPTNHPGGRAKVSITPSRSGSADLEVAAVDKAGNRGAFVDYAFEVRNTAPQAQFELNGVGLVSHITLSSWATDATAFGYTVDGGPETRVPIAGGKAVGDIVFDSVGVKTVLERTYAGKKMIGSETDLVTVTDAPKVTSDALDPGTWPLSGVPETFTFAPRSTGVVAYLYDFGDGDQQKVTAGPDGTVTVTWTPDKGDYYTITVYSVDQDGNQSQADQETFSVTDTHPVVYANTYGNHVGDTIDVAAFSQLPNAVAMIYSIDGGPEQTLDGPYVDFDVTPTHAGDTPITVWAKLDDGTLTPPTVYNLHIDNSPQVTTAGPFNADPVAGQPLSITFTAVQHGATSFRYTTGSQYSGETDPQQTVPVGADGTATVKYAVPTGRYDLTITVASLTAGGVASDDNTVTLQVRDESVAVDNPWPPDYEEPVGGLGIPGRFGFAAYDLGDLTTAYLWHVDDGAVQEIAPDPAASLTTVEYSPDKVGDHNLYVQRRFTDGTLSPLQTVPFEVGTHPLITSDIYQADTPSGGSGQDGIFRFSGGMPGVVSFDYQFLPEDDAGEPAAAGTATAAADGSAQVVFTPPAAGFYTVLVIGHTADGTATTQAGYRFEVAGS